MSTHDAETACPGAVATRVFQPGSCRWAMGQQRHRLDRACAAYGAAAIHAVVRIDTRADGLRRKRAAQRSWTYKQGGS